MKKQNKYINLLEIQKAYLQEQKRIAENLKGGVLVTEIPLSNAGFVKEDNRYITIDALNINALSVLQNCFK